MKKKICHLSSAHQGLDVRIFVKECASLAREGYETHLVITATANEVRAALLQGIVLHPLEKPRGRFSRMLRQTWRCFRIAKTIDADAYHFHDPELIPFGIIFSLMGKHVIYDVHENLPQDILSKDWIPEWARKFIARIADGVETFSARHFFSVIGATPTISERFKRVNPKSIDINNYPILHELDFDGGYKEKTNEICYIGGISKIRGIGELVKALELTKLDVRLNLAGIFSDPVAEKDARQSEGWSRVTELGFLDRGGVRKVLGRSMAGLVTLHPVENYLDALPVKMFEYMAAGIPSIASNFPLWKEIVEGNGCGICVDPLNPIEISEAIDYLLSNPEEAISMGARGRAAIEGKFNWKNEEVKLLSFYREIIGK